MTYRLGVDTGGTFTDFVLLDESSSSYSTHKTPSVPDDPSSSLIRGLREIATGLGSTPESLVAEISLIVHGTTVATNAVITGSGAATALLTTKGFRDALQMRRGMREDSLDNKLPAPAPLVPRLRRHGITERTTYEGEVLSPLSEAEVLEAVRACREEGVEAIAICFLHSYANPDHERLCKKIVAAELPNAYLTTSHELLAQIRLFERVSTTVLNAFTGPLIESYLDRLVAGLSELDFRGDLLIMQSSGGVTRAGIARERAAATLLSGPAAAPIAGASFAADRGERSCITMDMGGTSFDAALVSDGSPAMLHDGGWISRYRAALPMLAIHTIGAGGGSIASIDRSGILRVGPASAGAHPGPACYGRGGASATCTDANLILGYLNASNFLGGRIPLDPTAAREAIHRHVAQPLGITVEEAAAAMFEVINVNMTEGIREVSVGQGVDPRESLLVVGGGAGPVHAAFIASELGIANVLVPRDASVFAAAGMLLAEVRHDAVRGMPGRLSVLPRADLLASLSELASQIEERMLGDGFEGEQVLFESRLHLRYVGQFHEIPLLLTSGEAQGEGLEDLPARFDVVHETLYGWSNPGEEVELINLSVTGRAARPKPARPALRTADTVPSQAVMESREAFLPGSRVFREVSVLDGTRLLAGNRVEGAAVVEVPTTTVVVPEEWELLVTELGDFLLTPS